MYAIRSYYACTNSNQEQAIVKKYEPNFESLKQHEAAPEWFQDAKLGMYFHWGPYSVPAYGSAWYPSNMYMRGSDVNKFHEKNFGPIEEFGVITSYSIHYTKLYDERDGGQKC